LKLLRLLQKHCQHPSHAVKADIHEGDIEGKQVQWCECCGAFRFMRWTEQGGDLWGYWMTGEWREPRPDWFTPKERKEYLDALREAK
jgi:hypothetical protein